MKITVIDSKSGEILSVGSKEAPPVQPPLLDATGKSTLRDTDPINPLEHIRFADGREIDIDTNSGEIIASGD